MNCASVEPSENPWNRIPKQAWSWPVTAEAPVETTPVFPTLADGGPWQGLPLGGFGTGGIGRNYRGSFGRWTVKAGSLKHFCLPANMFSVRIAPEGQNSTAFPLHPGYPEQAPGQVSKRRSLSTWDWSYSGEGAVYHALFPKAWYEYPATESAPVDLLCEQFSPIIPHNYETTSYPVGVFLWHARNRSSVRVNVSVMFTFVNMAGWFTDFGGGQPERANGGNYNMSLENVLPDNVGTIRGVLMGRDDATVPLAEGSGQFCLAALAGEGRQVTFHTAFNPRGNGAEVWEPFATTGELRNCTDTPRCVPQQQIAGAICVSVSLAPGETVDIPMALSWDLPVIQFGSRRQHYRQYTRHLGRTGTNAAAIAAEALTHWQEWSRDIDQWHQSVIGQGTRPDWYYALLFNEAYMAVDGLTVWTDGSVETPGSDPFFGVIECPDYPYYCTLDLWVYGSFLLLHFWPELEKNVIRRFAVAILHEDDFMRRCPHTEKLFRSKVRGAAPHDFGEPREDPPDVLNSYIHQNSNQWKDLNCQYVLALYRDITTTGDYSLLDDCWPAVTAAIEYLRGFDDDGDGLIENDGTPDQTMDNIPMKGPSSYCGGLWIAALNAAVHMAEMQKDRDFLNTWHEKAKEAANAFERHLWTGSQYRFDTSGHSPEALFIDALFGIWYGRLCGLSDLVPQDHYRQHLACVYNANVEAVDQDHLGGANITGWNPPAKTGEATSFNTRECQISEVLSGLNISFAAQLMDAGLEDESLSVLDAVYTAIYEKLGLWFRTPAAWTRDGQFRAILNLRPLVVWALEHNRLIGENKEKPASA